MAGNKHLMIADRLKADIAGGKYADRIPGIHALAKEYGVNFKTVNKAVAGLEAEVPLTSVSLREDLIARSAAQLLGSASKSPAQIVMEPEVVIRESCGHRLASARPTRGRSGGRNK